MYKVELYEYGGSRTKVWDYQANDNIMLSGTLDKAINEIDAFNFNTIYNTLNIKAFKTLIEITNLKKNKVVYRGRILLPSDSMGENGAYGSDYTSEGAMAYLYDSNPSYGVYTDYSPQQYLNALITKHNASVEAYKQLKVGNVSFVKNPPEPIEEGFDPNRYSYATPEKSTMQHLIDDGTQRWGGELSARYESDGTYIDWLDPTPTVKQTELRIGKNIKSFRKAVDPQDVVTRLYPLGASETNEYNQEARITIASVNGGRDYIDIPELIALYGIQSGTEIFDDALSPQLVYNAAIDKINEIKKKVAKRQFEVNALDLSTIGLDPEEFECGAKYKVFVPAYNVNGEILRIEGTSEDITYPHNKTIRIGEKELNLSDVNNGVYSEFTKVLINNETPNIVNNIVNNTVPSMIETINADFLVTDVKKAIDKSLIGVATISDVDGKVQIAVNDFQRLTFDPYKLTVDNLMDSKITNFKNNSLSTIINSAVDAKQSTINQAVIDKINSSSNVIRADALSVDSALINKISSQQIATNALTSNSVFTNAIAASQAIIDRIKVTDIDLNKATIQGTVDGSNYMILTNDNLTQYGSYTISTQSGDTISSTGFTQLKNGQLRFRSDTYNRSLYITDSLITTNTTGAPSGELQFFATRIGTSSKGVSLYGNGFVDIYSFGGFINLSTPAGKPINLTSGGKVKLYGVDPVELESVLEVKLSAQSIKFDSVIGVVSNAQIKAPTFVGALKTETDNAYVHTPNELRITESGYNGGNVTYKDIRYKTSYPTSHEKYKNNINEWNDSVLDTYKNDLKLYSYKYNTDDESVPLQHGIILRTDSSDDQFPSTWRRGDGFDSKEVTFWNMKAIQELINKVDKLEEKINGTTA